MFSRPCLQTILTVLALWAGCGEIYAQTPALSEPTPENAPGASYSTQQYAGAASASGQTRGMRIVEVSPTTPSGMHYFTIVGGVKRSGVYTSTDVAVPVTTLVKAAGGLVADRPTSIRILSASRRPIHLYFSGETPETVRTGEVLVVDGSPESEGQPIVPVACLGLLDRPIVLPLKPEVASLPTLLHNLMQPAEIATRVKRYDPPALPQGAQLYSGTILIFDPAMIQPVGLKLAQEEQGFPPAVDLLKALNNAPPGPAAQPNTPAANQPPATTFTEPSPSVETFSPPAGMVVREFSAAVAQTFPLTESAPAVEPSIPLPPTELAQLPSAMLETPPTEVEALPTTQPESLFAPSLPVPQRTPELPQPLLAPAESPVAPAPPVAVYSAPPQAFPRVTPAVSEITIEPTPVATVPVPQIAPTPPATTKAAPLPQLVVLPDETPISRESMAENPVPTATTEPPAGRWSAIPIAIGLAVLTVLCFAACVIWSRYENGSESTTAAQTGQSSSRSHAPRYSRKTPLEEVIEQSVPIVEEPVELPAATHLHGEAVGHRRLIVHPAHEGVPAPKFAKVRQRKMTVVVGERELRSRLRSALRTNAAPTAASSSSARVDKSYDVVQPARPSTPPHSVGPLERALRSLAEGGDS